MLKPAVVLSDPGVAFKEISNVFFAKKSLEITYVPLEAFSPKATGDKGTGQMRGEREFLFFPA